MRGFAGLLVAAAFALVFFHSLQVQKGAWEGRSLELEAALKTAQLRAVEGDLRSSFEMVLRKAGGREKDAGKRAALVLLKLAEWEKFVEAKHAKQGIFVDVWMGAISPQEKTALPVEMLGEKKVLKCAACVDFYLEQKNFLASDKKFSTGNNVTVNEFFEEYFSAAGWSVYLNREGLASVSQAELKLT